MRGDLAPLDALAELSKEFNFHLILDDAHGTGVMGKNGKGTADYFNVKEQLAVIMATFSKTFAVTGGVVAGSKEVINYLRYFARPYVFSGSISPVQAATVLAGLDLLEKDDSLVQQLRKNIQYATLKFEKIGWETAGNSAIFTLPIPKKQHIREMAYRFHEIGIFVNAVEYPAVPKDQECFRISLMASHTQEDIDRLFIAINNVWNQE